MASAQGLRVDNGDVIVLVGTMKGIWLFRSDGSREKFESSGPHFPGREVYSLAYDKRGGRSRILAGVSSLHFGGLVCSSDNFGWTWTEPDEGNVKFPEGSEWSLKRVWQIQPAGGDQPDTVYAGVQPASLFRSDDGGVTFALVQGLYDHPHRPKWTPGNGGLCLHTVLIDPDDPRRMYVGISTGGVYRTEDGGESWTVRNQGIRAEFLPEKYPEFGQCVHKIAFNPARPRTLYLQNHWGLYRSDDGADSWTDIANGVPSDFGFPIVAHPHDPETAYVIPLESDTYRCTPEGRCRVYRTRNSGESWEPLESGLPQEDAHVTVVRDAFAADATKPAGLYFGTRQGELYASTDDGDNWRLIAERLPPIVCVKTAVAE